MIFFVTWIKWSHWVKILEYLRSITKSLTLPGEYVTGKTWHSCSAYHVFMYKKLGWILSYNSFQGRSKRSYKKKWKNHKEVKLYQVFICPKMLQHLQFIYCWHTLEAYLGFISTFLTTLPNFGNYLPLLTQVNYLQILY